MKLSVPCLLGSVLLASVLNRGVLATDVLTNLHNHQSLSCEPAEGFFCSNMHVSCAGKTKVHTFAFTLQIPAKHGTMLTAKEFKVFEDLYAGSLVDWGQDARYVIFMPIHQKGYIKLFESGKYVFRYYPTREQDGIMSLGQCH